MNVLVFSETKDRQGFIDRFSLLPEEVRSVPYRTGLLPAGIWHTFLETLWQEPNEFWIAKDGDTTLARIGAKVSAQSPEVGFIGFLEFDPDDEAACLAAARLIEAARQFLIGRRVKRIYAPVQFSTWFPYRYRISEDDRRFFAWEPVDPTVYLHAFEAAGFVEDMKYHSTAYGDLEGFLDKMKPSYEAALSAGYRIRPFDRSRWHEREIPALYRISLEAFKESYLFEPISLDMFTSLYVHIADKADQFSKMIVTPDGREVGYIFGFMDQHTEAKSRESYFIIKSLAVVPGERGRGLSNAIVYAAVEDAVEAGAEYTVSAMVRSGIRSESLEKKGTHFWRHWYSLMIDRITG